jgi:hypothetical protein
MKSAPSIKVDGYEQCETPGCFELYHHTILVDITVLIDKKIISRTICPKCARKLYRALGEKA